jgi:hypothetical protein
MCWFYYLATSKQADSPGSVKKNCVRLRGTGTEYCHRLIGNFHLSCGHVGGGGDCRCFVICWQIS